MNKKTRKEYRIWKAMKARCYAPSSAKNRNCHYVKKGITVCSEWKDSFEQFLRDMGDIPGDNYSIERIDNSRGYYPDNCKWIPQREQSKNRDNLREYTHNGETHYLKEWARIKKIKYSTLYSRVCRRGIPFENAIDSTNFDRRVNLNGEKHTVTEWCTILNINTGDIFSRIHRGWSKEKALTTPIVRANKR